MDGTTRTMAALRVGALSEDYGGCAIERIAIPRPGPGEVLIRVRAVAIGFPDRLMTRGAYHLRPSLPFTLGGECSGEVAATGAGVAGFAIGEEVIALGRSSAAEFAIYPATEVRRKLPSLDHAEAAALGIAYLTAYVALVRRARIGRGEWLLVHGAAGGVGLAAVDLGMALGARVIAASASAAKLAVVARDYAPDATIETGGGFKEEVKSITGGGADVIYDPVGGDVFDESVRCVAFDGRILVVGFAAGRIPALPVNLPLIKGFSVMGVRAGEYGRRFPQRGGENLDAICALAAAGRIRPRVHAAVPLARWREAFAAMDDRSLIGRVVLLPAP